MTRSDRGMPYVPAGSFGIELSPEVECIGDALIENCCKEYKYKEVT